jgi:hypothetical protein
MLLVSVLHKPNLILLLGWLILYSVPSHASTNPIDPFKASFYLYYKGLHLGYGHYDLSHLEQQRYRLAFSSRMSFFWLWDERSISSEFKFKQGWLYNLSFEHTRDGTGKPYAKFIQFDAKAKKILIERNQKKTVMKYMKKIQEPLLAQLQMRMDLFNQPQRKTFSYNMIVKDRVKKYTFVYVGEETVELKDGDYLCLKFKVKGSAPNKATYLWVYPAYAYLTIQAAFIVDGSTLWEMQLQEYTPTSATPRSS